MAIIVREGESIEKAIKRLRRYVEKERILSTYDKKRYHLTKGQKRRIKMRRAALLRKKQEMKRKKKEKY